MDGSSESSSPHPGAALTRHAAGAATGVIAELACPSAAAAGVAYATLLAAPSDRLECGNTAVRLRDRASGSDHRVWFEVDDPAAAARLLTRRGFEARIDTGHSGSSGDPASKDTGSGDTGSGEPGSFAILGRPFGFAPRNSAETVRPSRTDITGLDHLVFMARDRDQAVALFAGALDLDFRLDKELGPDTHQLFFRSPSFVVEVIAAPQPAASGDIEFDGAGSVSLWGLAWHSPDIERTHARLTAAGCTLSPIRTGRKPGTRIFTVRDEALATRTVVIGPAD